LLIAAKARFTIDFLTVAYDALINKPQTVMKVQDKQDLHDTPAFDRKNDRILI
jgi:hypothetical protein